MKVTYALKKKTDYLKADTHFRGGGAEIRAGSLKKPTAEICEIRFIKSLITMFVYPCYGIPRTM